MLEAILVPMVAPLFLKLWLTLNELRDAYYEAREDPIFNNDLNELLKNFAGAQRSFTLLND